MMIGECWYLSCLMNSEYCCNWFSHSRYGMSLIAWRGHLLPFLGQKDSYLYKCSPYSVSLNTINYFLLLKNSFRIQPSQLAKAYS